MHSCKVGPLKRSIAIPLISLALFAGTFGYSSAFAAAPSNPQPTVEANKHSEVLEMLERLSQSPECMNLAYLNYIIGPPSNAPRGPEKHYYWYSPTGHLLFEMTQSEKSPGMVTDSVFTALLPDNELDLQDVEKRYGPAPHKFFDARVHPTSQYSFAPGTTTDFTQPPDTFAVRRVQIAYSGAPLGQPPADEMERLAQLRRQVAFDHHQHGRYTHSIPLIAAHLDEHPEDAEARVALAEALKQSSHLNESIQQYQIAMSQTAGTPLADTCRKGLEDLRVLPSAQADFEEQHHDLDVLHRGQRFRQGDLKSHQPMQQTGQNGQPIPMVPYGKPLPAGYGQPVPVPYGQPVPLPPGKAALPVQADLDIQPLEPPMLLPGVDPVAGF